MKNEEIAKSFYYNEIAKTKNLFIEDENGIKIIYSYGYHFPIAIKFNDGYLFNKDGYSVSTTRHKNLVLAWIKDELTDGDYKTTNELKRIIDKIKYEGIKLKLQLIEDKI